jgi:hypothetical protein
VPVELTSYKDARMIISELIEAGVSNMHVRYSGLFNGGLKQQFKNQLTPVNALGRSKELESLAHYATEEGVNLYASAYTQYAFDDRLADSFSVNRHAAKYASREIVELKPFSTVWYGQKSWLDSYYLLRPQQAQEVIVQLGDKSSELGLQVAFEDIGKNLSGDYNPRNLTTREEVLAMHIEELSRIKRSGQKVMIKTGNAYALPFVDYIEDMPLTGQGFHIIDEWIPFYGMVIHGLIEYSGQPLNTSQDMTYQWLKTIETGAGLAFTFVGDSTARIQETEYTGFYGADYDNSKDLAIAFYQRYLEDLGHCQNQYIIRHEKLLTRYTEQFTRMRQKSQSTMVIRPIKMKMGI